MVVQWPGREPRWFELPPDAVPEVRISHPDHLWFERLGLRWHAFPTISDQVLELGGLRYPLAPSCALARRRRRGRSRLRAIAGVVRPRR
ncbi:nitric oxide synthase oxygenase [Kitasatospora sp. NPDC028055]|uniref:nitric oxide synthase oxygenase n=1 Tax=Kitasatospora sp. NPDC028055 TaxID=3155653 RepID=UPI0033F39A7B